MQLHQIKPKTKNKKNKRVGRGGKRGTYSGKGMKGQKSRAGRKLRPQARDIIKRIPKKRGYRFKSIKKDAAVVNIGEIEKNFKDGEKITPQSLFEKKLVRKTKGKLPKVKILGRGKLTKKLTVSGCDVSESVKKLF
ncbi:50S ribosomal protein L15 [Patescibacteria group bacterium]|nr:50S ribosomal protein L15 [Patescibacteria group bacterium]